MGRHKLTAVLLALVLALSLLSATALAAESDYRDTDGHWAEEAIDRWSDYGIIQGSDGLFNPNGALTRAHMAAILTRLLDLPAADSAGFADVQEGDWFADSINRCAAAGIMQGTDGRANPNARITRQQAIVMLARALGIQPVEKADLSAYKDGGAVSAYARGYVAAMLQAGIVNGVSEDTLGVGGQITRAATVTMLDRAITTYVREADTRVEAVPGGIVLAAADGVELTGRADTVLVAQGAGGGTVRLKGVTAEDLVVTAAHTTVVVDSRSAVRSILLTEQAVGSRVVVEKGGKVGTVTIQAPGCTVSVSGKVDDVITTESAQRAEVEVSKDGRVGEITVAGEETDITVSGKVDTVTLEKTAEDTTVEAGSGASIGKVDTAAEGTTVSGKGKVESVTTSGDNTTVTTKGTEVEVEKGTTGTTAGGKDVAGGTTTTTPGGSTSGGSSSGGSTNPSTPPAPTYYTVTFKNGEETVGTQSVVSGGKATAPEITVEDGQQVSWYTDSKEWFDLANQTITGNLTLNAVIGSNKFAAGDGTEVYPYLIVTATQFADIASDESGTYYELVKNIEVSEVIEYSDPWGDPGTAGLTKLRSKTLDGNGYTITAPENHYLFGDVRNSVIKNMNVDLNGETMAYFAMSSTFEGLTVTGSISCVNNRGGFLAYSYNDFTMEDCVMAADMVGGGDWSNYNAVFVGYPVTAGSTLTFTNCVNRGSLVSGTAAMFIANPHYTQMTLNITNCKNEGLIQATYPSDDTYTFNCITSVTNDGTQHQLTVNVDGDEYKGIAAINGISREIFGGDFINGPMDATLAMRENSDGTFEITPASTANVSYYEVTVGLYSYIIKGGTRLHLLSERIDANGADSYTSTMKKLAFIDPTWLEANPTATEGTLCGYTTYELDGVTYFMLTEHSDSNGNQLYTLNGQVKDATQVAVSAFDSNGKLLASAVLTK